MRQQDLESCPFYKICPACDKQVIASALVQLRINFTCIFKVFQIALVASRLGQFMKTLKILVKLILNCPRAHAISNSNWTEWSTIQGVIARVVSKSDEREARGRFEITSTITP